jgi:hypothetical protein
MPGSSADLEPVYYLVAIAGSVGGGVVAARSYFGRQREKWLKEGAKEANLSEKLETNTQAANNNTKAITELSGDLQGFIAETRRALDAGSRRFDRIENSLWPRSGVARMPEDPGERGPGAGGR